MKKLPVLPVLVALNVAVVGCSPVTHLEAAPAAPDPVCARMLQRLPRSLAGLERISTDAQATVAYGTAEYPITIRCGIEPPPPTTDRCLAVSGDNAKDDASVDWINPEAGSPLLPAHAPKDAWVFLTYGRSPALEVVVPAQAGIDQPAGILVALQSAATVVPAQRECIGPTDVTAPRASN